MTPPEHEPTLPVLPPDLHDELLTILFGDPRRREAALQALLSRPGIDVAAVRAHIDVDVARRRTGSDVPRPEIPGYRLGRCLGVGGMGSVFEAEQLVPLRRRVAIKLIKSGIGGREVTERFARERQSLAVMDHDAIAKIYDCGTAATGEPFFAMEYVDGQPIDVHADQKRLPVRARVELFLQVCCGVQHAHQKGVIHRDLKPGNILVVERDGAPFAKVIDFGIARAVVRDRGERLQTELGQLVGTPEYMSPEQANGDDDRVDTRTDVYSLGAVLYELLCGALPFPAGEQQIRSIADFRENLRSADLPRPSTRLLGLGGLAAASASKRRATVTSLRRELVGDLDWIVLRAMERDPERRYPSASALADDLQRHLDGLPVAAGPPSSWYRFRKFVRRYRSAFVVAGLVLLVIVGGLVGTGLALVRVRQAQSRFDLLANVVALRDARREAETLHPAWGSRAAALTAWGERRGQVLRDAVPIVRAAVAELKTSTRTDAPTGDEFLRETLSSWLADMESFLGVEAVEVGARSRWATGLAAIEASPEWQRRWAQAREAIRAADGVAASHRYAEVPIDLAPQEGLVPLGKNPTTGLWEFYDLRSAADLARGDEPGALALPVFASDGSIVVGAATGIVFVLVPGGTFRIGAQCDDPAGPNHDELAPPGGKVLQVGLAPFFCARHELTQGQWRRLGGAPTAFYAAGSQRPGVPEVTMAHPIEQVSWNECAALLARHGMQLPSDAQWEYACRAGTSTTWSFGASIADLRGRANLLDVAAQRRVPQWLGSPVPWDDGFVIHGPVGALPANAFGLHEMHGNVREWCADGLARMPVFGSGDGRQVADDDGSRMFRGGSFLSPPQDARSAWRQVMAKDWRSHDLGCRPTRPVLPRRS